MSTRRTVLVAFIAWVAVIAVGSTLVWTVISRVGEDLTTADPGVLRTAGAVSTVPATQPGVRLTRRPHPTRSASSAPTTASSAPAPVITPIVPTPVTSSAGQPTTHPTSQPSAQPSAQRRTWQGPGGFVAAVCHGRSISLDAAQADSGFRVVVEDRGPEQVHVNFRGQGDEGRETEVQARCQGGTPVFSTHTDS